MNNTIQMCIENLRNSLNSMSIDNFVVDTLEVLMQIERKEYLQNAKSDKGNGFYSRTFQTLTRNSMLVHVPRTRTGQFKPELLKLIKINQEQVDHFCISLYQKGMTTRDIEDLMQSFFGESVSHGKVSYLAEAFHDVRMAWMNTPLQEEYLVIFCDCTHVTVRRGDRYHNEAVYICYGVRKDYKRELLALEVYPEESAAVWEEVFEQMKSRGVKKAELMVSDGLKGMRDTILRSFKNTYHQSCVVHKMRNIMNKVRASDKPEVAADLKEVFNNFEEKSTKQGAIDKLEDFIHKWSSRYDFSRYFKDEDIDSLFRYIDFNPKVRRMIYTTNSIENLNRIIKKATKNKLSFESPSRLLDYIFMAIKDFEDANWMRYPVYDYKYFKEKTQFI